MPLWVQPNRRDQLTQIQYNSVMVASYTYDDGARRLTRTLGDTPGTVTTWTYGRSDNLPTAIADNQSVVSYAYTYDANKNKLTETLGSPMASYGFSTTPAVYDNEDRLTGWTRNDGNKTQSWSLSAAGDWNSLTENGTTVARTHDAVHQVTAVGGVAETYDAVGNLTRRADGQAFEWYRNQYLQFTGIGRVGASYGVDNLGRRYMYNTATGYGWFYVNSTMPIANSPYAGQELAEYRGTRSGSMLMKKYVYGEYIDEPVMMVNVSGTTETKYYYHANSLYSVGALTNQAGGVVERYSYTAYGKPTFHNADGTVASTQSSTVSNPYMFTGRRFSSYGNIYHYRAREYDPDLGRFVGRDPIGYKGGINLYRYVSDSPLRATDPSGLISESECCAKAKTPGDWGRTICCDGNLTNCNYASDHFKDEKITNAKAQQVISACVDVHEQRHTSQFTCDKCKKGYQEPDRLPETPPFQGPMECPVYKVQIACLEAYEESLCSGDASAKDKSTDT